MENQNDDFIKINKNSETGDRLNQLRHLMSQYTIDAYIVRTTDRYFNEYIPREHNSRFYISCFTGSTGDMLITQQNAYLIVDGRYYFQAPQEVDERYITVVKQPQGITADKVLEELILNLASSRLSFTVGLDGHKNTVTTVHRLMDSFKDKHIRVSIVEQDLVELLRTEPSGPSIVLTSVDTKIAGVGYPEKLKILKKFLRDNSLGSLLITKLESLSYLTNLRGDEIPFSSTFRGVGLVTMEGLTLFTNNILPDLSYEEGYQITIYPEDHLEFVINRMMHQETSLSPMGIIPYETSIHLQHLLQKAEIQCVDLPENILRDQRVIKNECELTAFKESFRKSDIAFIQTIQWIHHSMAMHQKISEKDVAEKIVEAFYQQGAVGLSFNPIVGSAENSAIIHYGTPNSAKILTEGDLLLIDAGAYYEGGYATDLTRTLFLGAGRSVPTPMQKKVYTTVLKSSLAGIYTVHQEGLTGYDLDKIVRDMNREFDGFMYGHGTGHGIGINVHEYPPSISNGEAGKKYPLQKGMLFTIEPGLYKEGYGGVRIENIVTISTLQDFKIDLLTFAPLDDNLIEVSMLTPEEQIWLNGFNYEVKKRYKTLL